MSEQRFDPLKEISNLGESITRTIEKGIRNVTGAGESQFAVDIYESGDNLLVQTEAFDGLDKKSLEISIENNVLTISVETVAETVPTDASYYVQERRFGIFVRTIHLPVSVVANDAKAKINDNRLLVTLPIDRSIHGNIKVTPVE